ncbi:hypothetical protein ACTMU2_12295 [Cupriavidus basilensis]
MPLAGVKPVLPPTPQWMRCASRRIGGRIECADGGRALPDSDAAMRASRDVGGRAAHPVHIGAGDPCAKALGPRQSARPDRDGIGTPRIAAYDKRHGAQRRRRCPVRQRNATQSCAAAPGQPEQVMRRGAAPRSGLPLPQQAVAYLP